MSPALESSGLVIRGSILLCSAVSAICQKQAQGISCVCHKLPTLVAEPCLPSVLSSAMAVFACLGCVWCLCCEWASPSHLWVFPKTALTWNCRVIFCVVLREAFVLGQGLGCDQMSALNLELGLPSN